MAQRRCLHSLFRHAAALLYSPRTHLHHALEIFPSLSKPIEILTTSQSNSKWRALSARSYHSRFFSSSSRDNNDKGKGDDEEEEEDDVDSEEVMEDENDSEEVEEEKDDRVYSAEEKVAEAEAIGYKVVGPLQQSDRVFKPYEPVFAVVQIGSHQFKVSNRDSIFTERLKFCDVNDKLILNKVLLLGSSTQTIVGRPIVPDAAVHAVVEEHALDAKVIIFKKKRRKNYRRTKGHRQELTKLRITDIQGIEKPELKVDRKPKKAPLKKEEKTAVAA